jgi:hypothetical protein
MMGCGAATHDAFPQGTGGLQSIVVSALSMTVTLGPGGTAEMRTAAFGPAVPARSALLPCWSSWPRALTTQAKERPVVARRQFGVI